MLFIKNGVLFDLVALIILISAILYFMYQGSKGKVPNLRTFDAIEAFPESVARAVEQNKAVFFSPGDQSTLAGGAYTAQCTASLHLMGYLAQLCAKSGAKFVAVSPPTDAGMLPAMQAVHREAYMEANRMDLYNVDDVRFPSTAGGGASTIAMLEILDQVQAASIVMIGAYSNDSMGIQEWGMLHDAMVIGGTVRQMMMFVAAMMAHYILIGDEIYAAGTKVSGDRSMTVALAGADVIKWVMVAVIIVGAILAFGGISITSYLKL